MAVSELKAWNGKTTVTLRKRSNAENEATRQRLIQQFAGLAIGEMLEYPILLDGIDKRKRWLVLSAIKQVQRGQGCIIANIHGLGYRKLKAQNYADFCALNRERSRRKLVRTRNIAIRAAKENDTELTRSEKLRLNKELSTLGLMAEIAKG